MISGRTKNAGLTAILLMTILSAGCKEEYFTSLELPEESQERGKGMWGAAVYLSEADEISDLFNFFLPAGGVLPILVTVRNDDVVTLRLHSRNGLPLRDEFSGFRLYAGAESLEPIHPLDAVRIIRNDDEGRVYRKVGGTDVVTGALLPPLGAWYVWEEYRSRREFKPLLEASLLPADFGGAFEPLTLSPGEEASGYLYFAVDPEEMPYDSVVIADVETENTDFSGNRKIKQVATYSLKDGWDGELIISLRPSPVSGEDGGGASFAHIDSLPSSQVYFLPAGVAGDSRDQAGGLRGFFALIPRGRGRSLVFGRPEPGGPAIVSGSDSRITDFSSDGVQISGAAILGDLAVCAVHFTRRSKVMVVDLAGGGVRLMNTVEFDRKTEKVFFLPGENGSAPSAFAVTSDAFCHKIPFEGGKSGSYIKLGNDVKNIAVDDKGRLFVFAGDELRINKRGSRRLFEPDSNIVQGRFDIEVVGEFGEILVMLGRGSKGAGDTLKVFDTRLLECVSSLAFPTGVSLTGSSLTSVPHDADALAGEAHAGVMEQGLLVHLDEGTLLDIGIDASGKLFIRGSAWFPGRLTAATLVGGVVTLFRDDGAILTGNIDRVAPTVRGTIDVPVGRSSARPR